jgi:uncharacterized small protein (DUF1192 family)
VAQEISRLEKKLAALSEEIAALKAEKQTKESSDENGRSE